MKTRTWVGPILSTVSVCLLAIGVLAANPALAQEIRGTFAGSYFPILSDYDDDGLPNSVTSNEMSGVSTVLGRFTSRSFGASVFEGEYCSGTEVTPNWVDDTAVYTAANGDELYAVLAQDSGELDSHLCFDFLDSTWRALCIWRSQAVRVASRVRPANSSSLRLVSWLQADWVDSGRALYAGTSPSRRSD